jgi:hypothetical protein
MEWKGLTREQRVALLEKQLENIETAAATIERFRALTQKWLKRLKAQKSDK